MRKVTGSILFIVGVVLLSRLAQTDLEFPLDADFRSIGMTEWRHFFTSLAPLHKPAPYIYFDGQLIANGFVGALLQWLAPKAWFPNDDAYNVAAAQIVSVLSYAGACVVFYAALLRAGVNVPIAAIVALACLLSPQVIDMALLRQDFLITLPMMVVFYCSVVIARDEEHTSHAVALGAALAVLATIKLTGPMFGLLPALAFVSRWRLPGSFIGTALLVFVPVYLMLMGRFVYYYTLDDWLALYPTGVRVLTSWHELITWRFSLYYNDDLVRGHGREFIALYCFCTVALAIIAIRDRDSIAAFLVLSLVAYSLYSATTMKYPRGGYHLLPLFFAVIAYAAMSLWRGRRFAMLRYGSLAVIALVMGSSVSKAVPYYQAQVSHSENNSAALGDLWRPAQRWLSANVKPLDRICIEVHSEWALPVAGFKTTSGPFNYPYTDGAALARYGPPSDTGAACDFVVLEDFHRSRFAARMRQVDPANSERWEAYFRDLSNRFPPVRFETARRAWPITWIELYRIR